MIPRAAVLLAILGVALPAVAAPALGAGGPALQEDDLAPRYREWLDVVSYIITGREREVFEALERDWQRDRFIQEFWDRRDPLPVTPENEFRIEHMRRWEYANEVLGRDTPVPGWKTDRGRVYIVHGAPFQVHPYPNTMELWPLEVWEYRRAPDSGLPSFYQIIFFKPRVFNEFRLYSPTIDGPEALLIANPSNIGSIDTRVIASKFPIVFTAAQQVAPGYDAMGSEELLARMLRPPPPPRPLGRSFLTDGEVSSEFLPSSPLELPMVARGVPDPDLGGYVDLAVEIPADDLRFVAVEDRYVLNYEVELEVQSSDLGTWRQPAPRVHLRMSESEVSDFGAVPILYRARLYLLPGEYTVRALLRNQATQRLGVAAADAVVPASRRLEFGEPVFFYVEDEQAAGGPVPFGDDRGAVVPWVRDELRQGARAGVTVPFSRPDGVAAAGSLELQVIADGAVVQQRRLDAGELVPESETRGVLQLPLDLEGLAEGAYELRVRWVPEDGGDAGEVVGRRDFRIVDEFLTVARLLSDGGAPDAPAAHHAIGQQYLRRDRFDAAAEHFRAALRGDPQNAVYMVDAAKTLVVAGQVDVAAGLLERALNRDSGLQEAWATLGLLRIRIGDFQGALEAYRRGLEVAPGTVAIYNGLAEAHLSLGKPREALEMLRRSLELNPDQQQVQDLVGRLESGSGDGDG